MVKKESLPHHEIIAMQHRITKGSLLFLVVILIAVTFIAFSAYTGHKDYQVMKKNRMAHSFISEKLPLVEKCLQDSDSPNKCNQIIINSGMQHPHITSLNVVEGTVYATLRPDAGGDVFGLVTRLTDDANTIRWSKEEAKK